MGKPLAFFNLPLAYLAWHFGAAWGDLWRLYTNISWFLFNFFSIKILLATFFAPWKRLHERGRRKGEGGVAGRLILNAVTRLVGILLRALVILTGLVSLAAFSLFSFALFALWLVLPLVAVGLLLSGLSRLLLVIVG